MPEDPALDPSREARPGDGPVVRTVLVCDLVESTSLVERLGDERAFRLARRHDRLARDLLERHGGREIDKTDGFLLLFRRPIQAVRFALDYHEALAELSRETDEPIRTRVGIHLGEVFLRENAPEDVARGAKPLEVEGLAKPMAARLMSLAEGGQTLLTRGAYELAARAARGEIPEDVRWLAHGPYRLRGVEEPVAVFEVGVPGRSPLEPPRGSDKAHPETRTGGGAPARARRRWRRLGAAGFAVLVGLVVFLVADPFDRGAADAFAFEARDWVVVGDFQNLTGDPVLDDSLELAFRAGLEQSRYANVVPDPQVRRVLARMKEDPEAPVDRRVGLEVCQREGAEALVLGSIAEVGRDYVLTGKILQPPTGRTVVTETARVRSRDRLLDGLETITRELRERLGEPLPEIEEASVPLEKVTTSNLEALRAYSVALQRLARYDYEEAIALLERAVALDPEFAMAWARLGTVHFSRGDPHLEKATESWDRALALEDRLTEFERLYIEAAKSWQGTLDEMIRSWSLVVDLYPDHTVGHHNLGIVYHWMNRYAEATEAYERAVRTKGALVNTSYVNLGLARLALGRGEEALDALEAARSLEASSPVTSLADTHLLLGRRGEADTLIATLETSQDPRKRLSGHRRRAVFLLERGLPGAALRALDEALEVARTLEDELQAATVQAAIAAVGEVTPQAPRPMSHVRSAVETFERALNEQGSPPVARPVPQLAVLGKHAARRGEVPLARRILEALEPHVSTRDAPHWWTYRDVLQAEIALAEGRTAEALTVLEGTRGQVDLFERHESLARISEAAGDLEAAAAELEWIRRHHGQALAEWIADFFGREGRVLAWATAPYHLGRLYEATGERERAVERYREFVERWGEGEPGAPWVREAEEALARLELGAPGS